MLREESLEDITDGRKYQYQDMVKADTLGCSGCTRCCEEMVDTIYLNPYDIVCLTRATGKDMQTLLAKEVELTAEQGVILPRFRKVLLENGRSGCGFLGSDGRCRVHDSRPDLCRLFPLGRLYEDGDFSYIMQVGQCDHAKVKTKVRKWIDIPDYEENRKFLLAWHDLLRFLQAAMAREIAGMEREAYLEKQNRRMTQFLTVFYMQPYPENAFYAAFSERLQHFQEEWADV